MHEGEYPAGLPSGAPVRLSHSESSANAPCSHYAELLHNVQLNSSLWTFETQGQGAKLRYAAIAGLDGVQFKQVLKAVCAFAKANPQQLLSILNAQDEYGATPLHCAAFSHKPKVIKALMKAGAEPNIKDEDGNTPLHLVLMHSAANMTAVQQCLQELLTVQLPGGRRSLADAYNKAGFTPLMYAILQDHAEATELLVKSGADLTAKCRAKAGAESAANEVNGLTPLQMGVEHDRRVVLERLLASYMEQQQEEEEQQQTQERTRGKRGRKTASLHLPEQDVVKAIQHMMPVWMQQGTAVSTQLMQHYCKQYSSLLNSNTTGLGDSEAAANGSEAAGTDVAGSSKAVARDQQQQQQGVVLTQLAQQLKQLKRARESPAATAPPPPTAAAGVPPSVHKTDDAHRDKRLCPTPAADQTDKQTTQEQQRELSPLSPAGLQPVAALTPADGKEATAAAEVTHPASVTPGPRTADVVTGGPGESQKTPPGVTPGPSGSQKTPGVTPGVSNLLLSPKPTVPTPFSGLKGPSPATASKKTAAAAGSSYSRQSARFAAALGDSNSNQRAAGAGSDGSAAAAASGGAGSGGSGLRLSRRAARLLGVPPNAGTRSKQQEQRQKTERLQPIAPVLAPTTAADASEPLAAPAAATAERTATAAALPVADKENEAPAAVPAGNINILAEGGLKKPEVVSDATAATPENVIFQQATAAVVTGDVRFEAGEGIAQAAAGDLPPAGEMSVDMEGDLPVAAQEAAAAAAEVAAAAGAAMEPVAEVMEVATETAAEGEPQVLAETAAVPAAVGAIDAAVAEVRDAVGDSEAAQGQIPAEEPCNQENTALATQQLLSQTEQQEQQQVDDEMEVDGDQEQLQDDETHQQLLQDREEQQDGADGDDGMLQQTQPVIPFIPTQQQLLPEQPTQQHTGAGKVAREDPLPSLEESAVQNAAPGQQQNNTLPSQQQASTQAQPIQHTQQQQGQMTKQLSADTEFRFAELQHKAIKVLLAKQESPGYGMQQQTQQQQQNQAAKKLLDLVVRMMSHVSRAFCSSVPQDTATAQQQQQEQRWEAIHAQFSTISAVLDLHAVVSCDIVRLINLCSSAAVVARHLQIETRELYEQCIDTEDEDYVSCKDAWIAAANTQAKLLAIVLQQQQQRAGTEQVDAVMKLALAYVRQGASEQDVELVKSALGVCMQSLSSYYANAAANSCSSSSDEDGSWRNAAASVGKTAIRWLQLLRFAGDLIQLLHDGTTLTAMMSANMSIEALQAAADVVSKYKAVYEQDAGDLQWTLKQVTAELEDNDQHFGDGEDCEESLHDFDERVELGLLRLTMLLMQQLQQQDCGSSSSVVPAVQDLSGLVEVVGSVLDVSGSSSSNECQDLQLEIVEVMNELRDGLMA